MEIRRRGAVLGAGLRTGEGVTASAAGRTALITGGGNGLGRAIARALAGQGARVLLTGRHRDKLETVNAEIGAKPAGENAPGTRVGVCDTSNPESVAALAEEFADEHISILVNNAGIAGPVAPLVEIDPADW